MFTRSDALVYLILGVAGDVIEPQKVDYVWSLGGST
jgi:hypothetical protein